MDGWMDGWTCELIVIDSNASQSTTLEASALHKGLGGQGLGFRVSF